MKPTLISQNELLKILQKIDGSSATFISLISLTDARLKKTNNPYIGTKKIKKIQGIINFNYFNSVVSQLEKENKPKETYEPGGRKYGFKKDEFNGCLLYGNGEAKLVVKVEKSSDEKYVYNNHLISKEKIESFLPNEYKSTRQGTDKEIIIKNYNISSIKKIKINKQTYKIK